MPAPVIKRTDAKGTFENFKELADLVALIVKGWFYRGRTISASLLTGDNTVRHGLGRVVTKIIPVMQDAASSFYYTATADPKNTITVNSSAPVNVTFYVD